MRYRTALGALVALAALTFAGNAFAHARVSPPIAAAKESQMFTLVVPTEKANAQTTGAELTLPAGFSIDSFVQAPGWKRIVQSTGAGESAVGSGFHHSALQIHKPQYHEPNHQT